MGEREESVAGSFYPSQKKRLEEQLAAFFRGLPKGGKSNCVVAPHAGYVYSGKTAAFSFNALEEAQCFVVLSPNHTGLGDPISVSGADSWKTPLGSIPIAAKER